MNSTTRERPAPRRLLLALLGGCLAVLGLPSTGRSDALPDFTGYTRPGTPDGTITPEKVDRAKEKIRDGADAVRLKWAPADVKEAVPLVTIVRDERGQVTRVIMRDNKVKFAGQGDAQKLKPPSLLGTVAFTVLDMGMTADEAQDGPRVTREMIDAFRPGRTAGRGENDTPVSSPALDTTARYLYLYQVVNNIPESAKGIQSASVFLFDPGLISSWGYFEGFGLTYADEGRHDRVPVSFSHPIRPEKQVYKRLAPAKLLPELYGFRAGPGTHQGDKPLARLRDDVIVNPDTVILAEAVNRYSFGPGFGFGGAGGFDRYSLPGPEGDALMANAVAGDVDLSDRSFLRSVWRAPRLLHPGQRSAVFGFTSNFPPVWDYVRLQDAAARPVAEVLGAERGAANRIRTVGDDGTVSTEFALGLIVPAGDNVVPAAAAGPAPSTGIVPRPTPPGMAAAGGAGAGFLGGMVPAIGGFGGGAFPAIGSAGFLAPRGFIGSGLGSGGGGGGGSGHGNGNGNNNGTNGNQTIVNVSNNNSNINTNNNQNNNTNNNNNCCCPDGTMVPEPSTWLLTAIGAGLVGGLWWWRGVAVSATA